MLMKENGANRDSCSYMFLCSENHIHEVHVLQGAVLSCFDHLSVNPEYELKTQANEAKWVMNQVKVLPVFSI